MENLTYRFPIVRGYTFSTLFLILDILTSLTLWLINAPKDEIIDNIENFDLKSSVLDLVCISFGRCIFLIFIQGILENATLASAQNGVSNKGKRTVLKLIALLILIGTLAYTVVKDVFILKDQSRMKSDLHKGLCIAAFVFSIVHFIVFFLYMRHLRNLHMRFYLSLNDDSSSAQSGSVEDGNKKDPKKKVNLKRLMTLAEPDKWTLIAGTVGLIGSTGSQTVAPMFFGNVIHAAVSEKMDGLNEAILILLAIYMGGAVCSFFRSWLYTLAGQSIVARIRKTLFNQILLQEIAFFDTSRTGELMSRLSTDSQVIQNALSVNISMLLRYTLQIIGSLIIMFITSPKLGGVLIAVIPIVGIGAERYGSFTRRKQKAFQDELANAATKAEEIFSSVRTVKSFSQEKKESESYGSAIDTSFGYGKQLAFASGLFNLILGMLSQGAIVLVLWYGGKLVHDRHMDVGELTSFILYALNVAMAFAFLSSLYGDFMKAVGASIRMFEIFDRIPILEEGQLRLPDAKVDICFENVVFNYPSRPDNQVLKSISFKIKPGETIALVGPSGGGKSTVIWLLERFYDPLEGEITIGGHPLPSLNTDWFRKRVGIVSQEPVLFASTIAENIAYGKEATKEEIEDAAKQANAHDFITGFEEGYDTNVGERGMKLSGGQKQRIAIARALLLNPDILLLDEATSALDAESEHLVQAAIDHAMVGRTVLIIAHRLSTVRNASRVLVIHKGTIAEMGTHDELLAQKGIYKKLVLRQLSKGDALARANSEPVDVTDENIEFEGLDDNDLDLEAEEDEEDEEEEEVLRAELSESDYENEDDNASYNENRSIQSA